ncbi:MAG: DNA-binding protein [Planctomycetota bacterium]|nr:MAG: DNA-binding protein [Planctomycetota bacterium]
MAKRTTKKTATKTTKPRTKSEIFTALAETTGLKRKEVSAVFEGLQTLIKKDISRGPGAFVVPGLMKIVVQKKPATKARTMPNPFKPGEMMTVKAKPARKIVKVRPLKNLKDMV